MESFINMVAIEEIGSGSKKRCAKTYLQIIIIVYCWFIEKITLANMSQMTFSNKNN